MIEVAENTAYRAVTDRKVTSSTSKVPFKPLNDIDAIYDDPISHKLEDSEKESIYENNDCGPCEYQYI